MRSEFWRESKLIEGTIKARQSSATRPWRARKSANRDELPIQTRIRDRCDFIYSNRDDPFVFFPFSVPHPRVDGVSSKSS